LQPQLESIFKTHRVKYELRESTEKHLMYFVQVSQGRRTDRISKAIAALNGADAVSVAWDEKKPK
ncbi:MAG: hypothetical protein ABIR28_05690, partial [Vicinamibacteria bacterium]